MSNVEFESNQASIYQATGVRRPGMVGWLIKRGWAKDANQANGILVALSIIMIIASVVIYFKFNHRPPQTEIIDPNYGQQ